MVLENLQELSKKENKVYTILLLVFLVIFTLSSFIGFLFPWIFLLYIPFLYSCVIIFALAFFFGKDVGTGLKLKTFIGALIISIIITTIFLTLIIWLLVIFIIFAIIAYIFITTTFMSWNAYNFSIQLDLTLYRLNSRYLKKVLRILLFIPSIIVIIIVFIGMFLFPLYIPLLVVLIGLLVIASIISVKQKRFYAWLGPFYVWLLIYSLYLLISALLGLAGSGYVPTPISVLSYFFDLFFIIYIISNILGDKAEWTKRQLDRFPLLKRANPDSVIMLLFISKVTLEFLSLFPETYIEIIKNFVTFLIFLPLIFILTLKGLKKYNRIRGELHSP